MTCGAGLKLLNAALVAFSESFFYPTAPTRLNFVLPYLLLVLAGMGFRYVPPYPQKVLELYPHFHLSRSTVQHIRGSLGSPETIQAS